MYDDKLYLCVCVCTLNVLEMSVFFIEINVNAYFVFNSVLLVKKISATVNLF